MLSYAGRSEESFFEFRRALEIDPLSLPINWNYGRSLYYARRYDESLAPMPTALAGQFIGALFLSHYYWVVAALQIAGGALLLVNRFVPLALVLLGPVIVNIICYHVFLNHSGAALAVVTILWFIVFYGKRQYFSGLFVQRT